MTDPQPAPMQPENPDHAGERQPDATPADDVGTTIDPLDPLRRAGDDDMPGLDPVVPITPSD